MSRVNIETIANSYIAELSYFELEVNAVKAAITAGMGQGLAEDSDVYCEIARTFFSSLREYQDFFKRRSFNPPQLLSMLSQGAHLALPDLVELESVFEMMKLSAETIIQLIELKSVIFKYRLCKNHLLWGQQYSKKYGVTEHQTILTQMNERKVWKKYLQPLSELAPKLQDLFEKLTPEEQMAFTKGQYFGSFVQFLNQHCETLNSFGMWDEDILKSISSTEVAAGGLATLVWAKEALDKSGFSNDFIKRIFYSDHYQDKLIAFVQLFETYPQFKFTEEEVTNILLKEGGVSELFYVCNHMQSIETKEQLFKELSNLPPEKQRRQVVAKRPLDSDSDSDSDKEVSTSEPSAGVRGSLAKRRRLNRYPYRLMPGPIMQSGCTAATSLDEDSAAMQLD